MSKYLVVSVVLALIFISCSGKSEQDIVVFDPSGDYPEFPLSLSDIADVSYIKMGGAEEGINIVSLWGSGIYIDDSHGRIFALDPGIGVMEFDIHGNFLRRLGRLGRGPGEYTTSFFYVIPEEEEVGIYDLGRKKFLVFKYDGSFLADKGLSVEKFPPGFDCFNIQNGHLIVYNPYSRFLRESTGKVYTYSEKTLELFPLEGQSQATIKDIHYAKPIVEPRYWGNGGYSIMLDGYLLPSYSGFMMATYRCDTTYVIGKDFSWRPFLVNARHNGVEEGCLYPAAETKDYLFLSQQNNLKGGDTFYFAIDKKTKQAYKITDDESNPLPGYLQGKAQISHRGLTKTPEYRYRQLRPMELKEDYYDYLPSELKSIVDQCDEDSNLILMLIRFKDVIQN